MITITLNTLKKIVKALGYVVYKKKRVAYNFDLYGDKAYILNNGSYYIDRLKKRYHKLSIKSHLEGFLVDIDKTRYYITSTEELYILNEVLVDDCYNFIPNKPSIVIDIGMNIGIASLYFASKINIEKIIAFEPVKTTFDQGSVNFKLNPSISSKIEAYNYGLGIKDETVSLTFNSNYKGSVGKIQAPLIIHDKMNNTIITAKLKSVETEIINTLSRFKDKQLVLKMDCEGCEFDLIPILNNAHLLSRFSYIMMEYHGNEPSNLCDILQKNNFKILQKRSSHTLGMIYAFKND